MTNQYKIFTQWNDRPVFQHQQKHWILHSTTPHDFPVWGIPNEKIISTAVTVVWWAGDFPGQTAV